MRRVLFVLFAIVAALGAPAATMAESSDLFEHPFSADFAAGKKLRLHVRSGDVRIVGADQNKISVELSGRNASRSRDVSVRLTEKQGATIMRVTGGRHNELTITIRIPRETDLYARIPFGDVEVENVVGNKDIEVHAGDLSIAVGRAEDYAHVDASVTTGDLDGTPFGESREGFFRSFRKEGSGRYRLHAHVGAGDLSLR